MASDAKIKEDLIRLRDDILLGRFGALHEVVSDADKEELLRRLRPIIKDMKKLGYGKTT